MSTVRRRDVGIGGALVIISQALTSFHSSHSINEQLEKLRDDLEVSKSEREQYFVRKTELNERLDRVSGQLAELKEQVGNIKHRVDENYSMVECDPMVSILGCGDELVSYR